VSLLSSPPIAGEKGKVPNHRYLSGISIKKKKGEGKKEEKRCAHAKESILREIQKTLTQGEEEHRQHAKGDGELEPGPIQILLGS